MPSTQPKPYQTLLIVGVILVLGAVGSVVYFKYQSVENRVARLTPVPKGERPQVSIVSHADRLRDQPFFKDAKDGDKLLVYPKAKKAVLYDPRRNVVVAVAP